MSYYWPRWFAWHPVKTDDKGWRWLVFVYRSWQCASHNPFNGYWLYNSVPTVDIELTTTKVAANPRKLKSEWKCEISPWMILMCSEYEPDMGMYPGTVMRHNETGEEWGIEPENPGDPDDQWKWRGWHKDEEGVLVYIDYADAYNKIFLKDERVTDED